MKPIIYQVLPRLFGADVSHPIRNGTKEENGCGKFADFTGKALTAFRDLGANYIWLTGILCHATKSGYAQYGIPDDNHSLVKGLAGSPYAVKDYYDVCPDLATDVSKRMREFENLVARCHKSGLRVIIDFIPNHVAAEYKGTCRPFTDMNYYPGHYHDGDWTDTAKLNYNNRDTWHKMLDILLFWAGKGVDGFRCDMAELVPCEFWGWVVPQVKEKHRDVIFVGEVYDPSEYRNYIHNGHFDYLYDKVGLYDTLRQVVNGQSASLITGCWQAVDDIRDHMLNFLENHDEQRLASEFFAGDWRRGRPALLVSALLGTNPFMIYFGQELGEPAKNEEGFSGYDGRTTIFDYWTIDTIRRWRNKGKCDGQLLSDGEKQVRAYYNMVLNICNTHSAISDGKMFDLMYANYENTEMDTNKVYAFLRASDEELVVVAANFSDCDQDIKLRIPEHAFDYLHLPEMATVAFESLLPTTFGIIPGTLLPHSPLQLTVPAHDGLVLSMSRARM